MINLEANERFSQVKVLISAQEMGRFYIYNLFLELLSLPGTGKS